MHAVAQWIPKHTIQTIVSYRLTIAHSSCYAPTITGACNESGKKNKSTNMYYELVSYQLLLFCLVLCYYIIYPAVTAQAPCESKNEALWKEKGR